MMELASRRYMLPLPRQGVVGGEGCGEGAVRRFAVTLHKFVALPPHPTLSPKLAWGRGLERGIAA